MANAKLKPSPDSAVFDRLGLPGQRGLIERAPLDQPGVELGKQLTYYQFGHPGWTQMRATWEALPPADPDWVL